ncbi:MAG: hypothetical protein ACXVC7_11115 [Bacteroidia bacterium]
MKTKRACIYPKDIQRITGKSERYSQKLFQKMKAHYNKSAVQFITISEFCQFTGLDQNTVEAYILD